MARSRRPQALFVVSAALLVVEEGFRGWCRVKTATPAVTRATTAYLYSG